MGIMGSKILHSAEYKQICAADPEHRTYVTAEKSEELKTKITNVSQKVIGYLQTPNQKVDADSVSLFIAKVEAINQQFEAEHLGSPFAASIVALKTLLLLKEHPDESTRSLVSHPFIAELTNLSDADTIQDPEAVSKRLQDFLKTSLNPALRQTRTPEELKALSPLIQECLQLKEKLADLEGGKELAGSCEITVNRYSLQIFRQSSFYKTITSYKKGDSAPLRDPNIRQKILAQLDKNLAKLSYFIELKAIPPQDQIAIYNALFILQQEFEEHGAGGDLDRILAEYRKVMQIPKGINSSFPIVLQILESTPSSKQPANLLPQLITFQNDILIPAVQKASTREKLEILRTVCEQCGKAAEQLDSAQLRQSSAQLESQFKIQYCKTERLYSFLISYKEGSLVRKILNIS